VVAVLVLGYLLLTAAYVHMGYLRDPASRIKPVDSVYYYAYLRSALFDRDLDFTNELARLYPSSKKQMTDGGLPPNPFSIGPAICWAPFFALAHVLTLLAQLLGAQWKADGYSDLYQLFVYAGNSLYSAAGLIATASLCRLYLSRVSSLLACLALLFASQLTYYFWPFTAMSHNVSFFWTALFLYLFLKSGPRKLAAVAAGFMVLARWQDAIFLVFPIWTLAGRLIAPAEPERGTRASCVKDYAVFFAIALLLVTPQPLAWWVVYGRPFLIPQGQGFIDLTRLPVFSVLFSLRHGLFAWHPSLLMGALGLPLLWTRDRMLVASALSALALQVLLNSSLADWWAGWSFGNRRFISLLPVFALGFGAVLDRLGRYGIILGASLVLLMGTWNQLFVFQYVHGLIPRGEALTWRQMFPDKFRLPSLMEIQRLNQQAVAALNRRDVPQFKKIASRAFSMKPAHPYSHMTYGLACLLAGEEAEGIRVFQSWHALDSRDILARWGLAEYAVRRGNREAAKGLFANCREEDGPLCMKILSKIDRGGTEIIDETFFDLFQSRLMAMYRE